MRTLIYLFSIAAIVMSFSINSFAQEKQNDKNKNEQKEQRFDTTKSQQVAPLLVDNLVCPVSGEEIDKDDHTTYTYSGKTYNLCCKKCLKKFKADPEKYIERLNKNDSPSQDN